MEQQQQLKYCYRCHAAKNCKFYANKCANCYNQERNNYYHVKKTQNKDLEFVNRAINNLKCCEFKNNEQHKKTISLILTELENIFNTN